MAGILERLLIGQTKSRPRQSNGNGLVESKNRAAQRKQIGYGFIKPTHAGRLHAFYRNELNPYVNFHRPSAQEKVS